MRQVAVESTGDLLRCLVDSTVRHESGSDGSMRHRVGIVRWRRAGEDSVSGFDAACGASGRGSRSL